jgi:hypothetical protein
MVALSDRQGADASKAQRRADHDPFRDVSFLREHADEIAALAAG